MPCRFECRGLMKTLVSCCGVVWKNPFGEVCPCLTAKLFLSPQGTLKARSGGEPQFSPPDTPHTRESFQRGCLLVTCHHGLLPQKSAWDARCECIMGVSSHGMSPEDVPLAGGATLSPSPIVGRERGRVFRNNLCRGLAMVMAKSIPAKRCLPVVGLIYNVTPV